MDRILLASSVSLAGLAVMGGLAVSVSGERGSARWAERIGLLLHHAVALGVAVATPLCALLGADTRALFLCAAGPLLVLCLQGVVPPRAALWSVPIVGIGLVGEALVLAHLLPGVIVGGATAFLGAAACVVAAVLTRRSALSAEVPRQRALHQSHALALCIAAFGGALAMVPNAPPAVWASALGAAGAFGTAARLDTSSPPSLPELVAGAALFPLSLALALVLGADARAAVAGGLWTAFGALGVFALVRAVLRVTRLRTPTRPPSRASNTNPPQPAALGAMSPLFDDAALARPSRPRVVTRVAARRVLEAALDRARAAQPYVAGPQGRELLRVDITANDNDVDLDADPSELSEALCAVLDRALRLRADRPDARVQVQLRGGPSVVTFEIADLTDAATPLPPFGDPTASFLPGPAPDPERPDGHVALSRARLLIEKNGGKLVTRDGADGSHVQVTVPRRVQKGAFGQA